jgi:DNA-binding XRE family transcriptional regulator
MLTPYGIYGKKSTMNRTSNFDRYLAEQLKDAAFAAEFRKAGEAWDVALKLASLRKAAGLSQKELARRVGTSQQQISRLESPAYEGHSLSMLRRVADVLGANIRVEIQPKKQRKQPMVAESKSVYRVKRKWSPTK